MSDVTISRRSVLRASLLGLAGVAVGFSPIGSRAFSAVGTATAQAGPTIQLAMRECLAEMVDLTPVYMWAFDSPEAGLRIPGPVLYTTAGDPVAIEVTNDLPGTHAFAVPGVVASAQIPRGETVRVEFTAPAAGTYIYLDPLQAPVNRAMGLAGALVVRPRSGTTPYAAPTGPVQALFDDLGTTGYFPGDAWKPERSWLWVFSSVDPDAAERVADDPDLSPATFAAEYRPRYFMLNGKTGFFASSDPASTIHGRVGQPALVRVANVGLATHSPHVHGNHVYLLAENGRVHDNVIAHDTWEMLPLSTADVLLPFTRPPDAYPWPPSDPSVWTTDLGGDGHTGMVYPMHCHAELSLLADGGNYPHGLITHWALTGDLQTPTEEPTEEPTEQPTEEPTAPPPGPGRGPGGPKEPKGPKEPRDPKPPKEPKGPAR